ncbi:MAG: undecaprenyl-phosphate glucose phosphotransferase, partial [Methanosphaera sp.]|nr:undecaprenyl-phosphate glucose phosphotransferase [Methanosphaera sp.]
FNVILDVVVLLVSTLFINNYFINKFLLSYLFTYNTIIIFFSVLIPSYVFFYYMIGLYKPQRTNRNILSEASKILQVNFLEYLFLSIMVTLDLIVVSVNFLVLFLVVNSIFAIIERSMLRRVLRAIRSHGYNIKYILIVGAGEVGIKLLETINRNDYLGYNVIGFLDDNVKGQVSGVDVIGTVNDIEYILAEDNVIDRVIVSISPRHYKTLDTVMQSCEKMGIRADIVPDYYRYVTSNPSIELIDDIPLISVRFLPLDINYNKVTKRIMDILFSIVSMIILSPLLLIVAIIIKLTSPGPVIYSQKRVGKDGEEFRIYKFRSMINSDDPIDEIHWTQKDDPRITNIGKIIRKTSIDELPQLYNILKGDMSLIGPRPERPYLVNKFQESVPKYMIKHHVKPGMTGWAQVNGYRGNTSITKRIEYDIYYVENWSIMLDIRIFFKTWAIIFRDQNAY